MKLFVAKLGSKATPSKPRSPFESTVSDTNGVGSKAPFLKTRNCPPCWQTKRRPSGAKAMAVGLVKPLANCVSMKLVGSVAARALDEIRASHDTTAKNNRRGEEVWPIRLEVMGSPRERV